MIDVTARLRRLVVDRAGNRCEYCGLSQEGQEAAFHTDHVVPRASGGLTVAENLALACVSYSLRKEARRSALDPQTYRGTALFHPRRQRRADHSRWDGVSIVGLTPTGRATIGALQMNRPMILSIRQEESARGRHPPPR